MLEKPKKQQQREKRIPSVFLSNFDTKGLKIYNKLCIKRKKHMEKNKTHKFSDYPLLNFLCIQHFCCFCCCCSLFSQTYTQAERRMSLKPFERITYDHKADSRLLFTFFFTMNSLFLYLFGLSVFFFGFACFDFRTSDVDDGNDM